MGFVKTEHELARIRETLATPSFGNSQVLTVSFATDSDLVRELLPPGFEPQGKPEVRIRVGRWQSNCCGDFSGGGVYLPARFDDHVGDYVLAMWMDTDPAVAIGRQVFGEPKKLAACFLTRTRDGAVAWIERHGVRLVEARSTDSVDLGGERAEGCQFSVKATIRVDGSGLDGDAIVIASQSEGSLWTRRRGVGHVALTGSLLDPLDELVVRDIGDAWYVEGETRSRRQEIGRISADAFFPHALGQCDDWSLMGTI